MDRRGPKASILDSAERAHEKLAGQEYPTS